jgi:hypothetical protein
MSEYLLRAKSFLESFLESFCKDSATKQEEEINKKQYDCRMNCIKNRTTKTEKQLTKEEANECFYMCVDDSPNNSN